MAAPDAVRVVRAARDEARAGLERLRIHALNGNIKGMAREARFLGAIESQSRRLVGVVTGVSAHLGTGLAVPGLGLGDKALAALRHGPGSHEFRWARSALLADYSNDLLAGVRGGVDEQWVWTANMTACSACLTEHGTRHSGIFVPMHPSCLCVWQPTGTEGLRRLTNDEMGRLMLARGGRDAQLGQALLDGRLNRGGLRQSLRGGRPGQFRQRTSAPRPALDDMAAQTRWTDDAKGFLKSLPSDTSRAQVARAFRAAHPTFEGTDTAIWAQFRRQHGLIRPAGTPRITRSPRATVVREPTGARARGKLAQDNDWIFKHENLRGAQFRDDGALILRNGVPVFYQPRSLGVKHSRDWVARQALKPLEMKHVKVLMDTPEELLYNGGVRTITFTDVGVSRRIDWVGLHSRGDVWLNTRTWNRVVRSHDDILTTFRHELGHSIHRQVNAALGPGSPWIEGLNRIANNTMFGRKLKDYRGRRLLAGENWLTDGGRIAQTTYEQYLRYPIERTLTTGEAASEFWAQAFMAYHTDKAALRELSGFVFRLDPTLLDGGENGLFRLVEGVVRQLSAFGRME